MRKLIKKLVSSSIAFIATLTAMNTVSTFALGKTVQPGAYMHTITQHLEKPIVFTLDETSAAAFESASNNNTTRSLSALPSYMWGAYNADDDWSFLQINSGGQIITFRGASDSFGTIFANGDKVNNIYYSATSSVVNFSVTYSNYYSYTGSNFIFHGEAATIFGCYYRSSKTIVIDEISYAYQ